MSNIRQLEHVVALAEHRNFGRAATALALTQSALTQSIQKLEAEYGVLLFQRSKRDVQPTAFGEVVIDGARQMLAQAANLRREIDLMKNMEQGRLVIGCDPMLSEALIGPTLTRMSQTHPHLQFSLRIGGWRILMEDLLARRIDVYIGSPLNTPDERLRITPFELPEQILVCRPGHPLTALDEVTFDDCLQFPLVGPPYPQWYQGWVREQLGEERGRQLPSYFLDSDDYGVIRWLVRNTDAFTAGLPAVMASDIANGTLCQLTMPSIEFPLPAVVATLSGRALAPAANMLIAETLDQAARMTQGNAPHSRSVISEPDHYP